MNDFLICNKKENILFMDSALTCNIYFKKIQCQIEFIIIG